MKRISELDRLPQAYNQRVDPSRDPRFNSRQIKPVTWEDLENSFHATSLRNFTLGKVNNISELSCKKIICFREDIDLYTRIYKFGRILLLRDYFIFAQNYENVIDEIAGRRLYINIWGYVPDRAPEDSVWAEYEVPDKIHQYLLEKIGPKFLGWENGEQDGRYVFEYAHLFCPAPRTRKEAHAGFVGYFRRLCNDLQNYMTALSTLPMPHYFADLGNHRLLGVEIAQALPSVPMLFAFVRGAGKQYGLLWFSEISVWNRWGSRNPDLDKDMPLYENFITGPTAGTSLSLIKRLWYVGVMYNSCIMGLEAYQLSTKKKVVVEIDCLYIMEQQTNIVA